MTQSKAVALKGGGSDDEDAVLPKVVVDRLADIHVMTVGINRPEKRNCVDEETADLLAKVRNRI